MIENQLLYFRGRVALKELLIASGIKKDEKVAIQAYTCSAVPEGVFAANALPIYIDVIKRGVTMCPDDLADKLEATKDVKAIVIQHTFGIVADLKKILKIAKNYNLTVIEDCCHTFNSKFNENKVGSFSDASFYSFEWGKPISLGLGGAVRVNNKRILERLELQYKKLSDPPFITELQLFAQRIAFFVLYNPRTYWTVKSMFHFFSKYGLIKGNHTSENLTEQSKDFDYKISKTLRNKLAKKLSKLNEIELKTQSTYSQYKTLITELSEKFIIETSNNSDPIFVRYPIWVSNKNELIHLASLKKIEISDWYLTPVHPYTSDGLKAMGYEETSCPNAELSSKHIVSLPLTHRINEKYLKELKLILVS